MIRKLGICSAEGAAKKFVNRPGNWYQVLYFDPALKLYRAGCCVLECPCNEHGVCSSRITLETFVALSHEHDGDNCVKMVCG